MVDRPTPALSREPVERLRAPRPRPEPQPGHGLPPAPQPGFRRRQMERQRNA